MNNVNLNTEDRALRSGKSTKQNAHNCVLALDIQSLMNTILVLIFFFKIKIKQYEGGLGPGTLELKKCLTKVLPLV